MTIAMLGAIESLLSATVADGVIGDHHNSNTELIGQGLANIASPLFGGIPATGANTTVGQFSQAVIDNNDSFLEGDQLTFFHGRQTIDSVTRTPRATIKGYKVVLDTAADAKLWDVVDKIGFSVADNCLATSVAITNGAAAWVMDNAQKLFDPSWAWEKGNKNGSSGALQERWIGSGQAVGQERRAEPGGGR